MTLRRHVRLWALTWLVLQASTLAAFVPRDCCAAHRPAAVKQSCHQKAASAHCPMRDASAAPCPMHRDAVPPAHAGHATPASHDQAAGQATPESSDARRQPLRDCVMRGTCHGQTFVSVLSYPGILPDATFEAIPMVRPARATELRQAPLPGLVAPDPHPPRA